MYQQIELHFNLRRRKKRYINLRLLRLNCHLVMSLRRKHFTLSSSLINEHYSVKLMNIYCFNVEISKITLSLYTVNVTVFKLELRLMFYLALILYMKKKNTFDIN